MPASRSLDDTPSNAPHRSSCLFRLNDQAISLDDKGRESPRAHLPRPERVPRAGSPAQRRQSGDDARYLSVLKAVNHVQRETHPDRVNAGTARNRERRVIGDVGSPYPQNWASGPRAIVTERASTAPVRATIRTPSSPGSPSVFFRIRRIQTALLRFEKDQDIR